MKNKPLKRSHVNPLWHWIAVRMMHLLGWRIEEGDFPMDKCVITAAPHTTNWDLFYTLLSAAAINAPMWFMMKHTHFWWPMNLVWRRLGGVPINRGASSSVVSQMAAEFNACDRMYLVIPPTGTRKKVEHWKTGFYYIAKEAGVPIWPWYINYTTKKTGSGPLLYATDDVEADFARLRAWYEEQIGPMPECRPGPRKNNPA